MGIKELAQVAGLPDTHASLLYRDQIAPRDGTEAARLRAAGAVLLGLTTSPEFGSSNWTRSYLHGVTRNPWNPERTPGGSSGGSAAAVAVGMMPICSGSDGGGSIRIPAAYSGLFGFKVTFGRVGSTRRTSTTGSCPFPVRCAGRFATRRATSTRSRARPTSTPHRCRSRPSYEEALLSGDAVDRTARPAGGVVVDARLRGVRPRGREARGRSGTRARQPTPASSSSTSTSISRSPGGRGASSRTSTWRANHLEAFARQRRRHHARCREPVRDDPRTSPPTRSCTRCGGAGELLRAIAAVFEQVDLMLTPTTATTAFAAEGPPPMEIAGQTRRRHGLGAVHRAVQHLGHARGEHPGRHERRRAARRRCRSSPAATKRSSCSRAARSPRRTAPGPSSPRWRTRTRREFAARDTLPVVTERSRRRRNDRRGRSRKRRRRRSPRSRRACCACSCRSGCRASAT